MPHRRCRSRYRRGHEHSGHWESPDAAPAASPKLHAAPATSIRLHTAAIAGVGMLSAGVLPA